MNKVMATNNLLLRKMVGRQTRILLTLSSLVFSASFASNDMPTFADDLSLLNRHFEPIVLQNGEQKIAVLGELQGRIMMASASGESGNSIGWIKRSALLEDAKPDGSIGGADRLWFGPDGGVLSVFFDPGVETKVENIRPPSAVHSTAFNAEKLSETNAIFSQDVSFSNHKGFEFNANVQRSIALLSREQVNEALNTNLPGSLRWVAYGSDTQVTNTGEKAWVQSTGLFSIWSLGVFAPSATVVVPLAKPLESFTPYFDNTSPERQKITPTAAFYLADAKQMDKVGIPPSHTTPFIGSYDAKQNMLTLIHFNISSDAKNGYVNAVWDWDAPPYEGEIINIFNDGPQADGKPFGPFYEMETSSKALDLAPQESARHFHNTYHFIGDKAALNKISKPVLGVTIEDIESAFANQAVNPKQP